MVIDIKNVTKRFGKFTALSDVSLTVPDGKLVALLGPSGSGKTTLLRIIAGLEAADGGQVLFDGEDVARDRVGQRRVGFVFQHYALFRHLSVFENIAFGLRVRPWRLRPSRKEIRRKVGELLSLIQLENLGQRYPSQLSGGQRQRVALARALAIEPKVLLLDEPFGALDAKVRQDLRRWLRRLHDEIHVTSVFVTHDQEEAMEVADQVVVMNQAKVEQVGTPDDVFHRPATPFVMNFLGSVNLFHGRLDGESFHFTSPEQQQQQAGRFFVRPHELDLRTRPNGHPTMRAKVLRIQSAGPAVKVELRGEGGQLIQAEVPHERFGEIGVGVGAEVYVAPKRGVTFDDYSI